MRPTTVTLLALTALPALALGGTREAAKKVRQGITHFRDGDYETAAKAFADADVARPDDPWIAFDRACAYAAQGDGEKAKELFEQAALARDLRLAVKSRYNLGSIAAEKARALFGEKPEEASPEVRSEGLALLLQAVGHYRDCLELDASHADARHNLEVLRLWIKHMEDVWRERDRQKQRKEMGLLEFLQMIEGQQRVLRSAARALSDEPDSPKRRQALVTTESSQRSLAEEIEPLKEKIKAAERSGIPNARTPGRRSAVPKPPRLLSPEAQEKAVELLTGLANEAREAMFAAADELHGGSAADAAESQTDAVEKLNRIYLAVVPFPSLVQRAIGAEQGLVDQVAPAVENPDDAEPPLDFAESSWEQRFVAGWAEALAPKAEQALKSMENLAPSATASPPDDDSQPAQQPGTPDPKQRQQQMEALKQSLQKAVELGPKAQEAAEEAAAHLKDEKPAEALPKQEKTLKLLKEIADPLPKQDQQQQGDQQKNDEQGDRKQDQGQSGRRQQQQQARRPQDSSQRQAEAVLRKVRERQRERRDLEKQLQQYLSRPGAVEKDW